jgi:DNA-binding NtrC family response regulator
MGSYIKGKNILAVDDEQDILETIEDILEEANLDCAGNYQEASEKIKQKQYDIVILDIMGVNGMKLLEESVQRNIPAVMLTAHSINPDSLMESIRKGAIAYLPKEILAKLDDMLNKLLEACEKGEAPWKMLFQELGDYFDKRFGANWKKRDHKFWSEFSASYQIGKGIQERLMHDEKILGRGI